MAGRVDSSQGGISGQHFSLSAFQLVSGQHSAFSGQWSALQHFSLSASAVSDQPLPGRMLCAPTGSIAGRASGAKSLVMSREWAILGTFWCKLGALLAFVF